MTYFPFIANKENTFKILKIKLVIFLGRCTSDGVDTRPTSFNQKLYLIKFTANSRNGIYS